MIRNTGEHRKAIADARTRVGVHYRTFPPRPVGRWIEAAQVTAPFFGRGAGFAHGSGRQYRSL